MKPLAKRLKYSSILNKKMKNLKRKKLVIIIFIFIFIAKPSVNVGNKNISAMNDAINFDSSDDQK